MMDVADRIKSREDWVPPASLGPGHEAVNQWAIGVAQSGPSNPARESKGESAPRLPPTNSYNLPLNPASKAGATSSDSRAFTSTTLLATNSTHNPAESSAQRQKHVSALNTPQANLILQHDPSSHSSNNVPPGAASQANGSIRTARGVARSFSEIANTSQSSQMDIQCDNRLPHGRVRKLTPPISTRKLTKKEGIILWGASIVNGFKCPPWEKNPASSEFALEPGAELFT